MPLFASQKPYPYSRWALWLCGLVYLWLFFNLSAWKQERVIVWDAYEYYIYLPAFFIHHSFDLQFAMPELLSIGQDFQWNFLSPTGQPVCRMSMGLAMMNTPFFLLGHLSALVLGYPADGFSAPYYFWMLLGAIVFVGAGNYFLRKVLLRYFTDGVTAVSLILLNLSTNLFYYVNSNPLLTHLANFALFSFFIYLCIGWYERPRLRHTLLLGFTAGMLVLCRPTNVLMLLVFPLWGLGLADVAARFRFLLQHWKHLLLIFLAAFLVWVPQMFYWQMQTGQWYYYSYGFLGRFYFNSPHLWDALFSYRKGWLLYTPLMLFALAGIFLLKRYCREAIAPLLIFVPLNYYVVSSFWCWWYGAGFGLRPMVDSYALMALPLAAFVAWLLSYRHLWKAFLPLALFLVLLNQVQAYQSRKNILHFDSVGKAYYWKVFMKLKGDDSSLPLLEPPDYKKALHNGEEY